MPNIILLKDLSEDKVDAVIIAKKSTAQDVEKAILKAKEEKEYDWQFEDLLESMPNDCKVYTTWAGEVQSSYY